ncbi:MAG: L-aspartate oxidase [Planctomycetota bacterium]
MHALHSPDHLGSFDSRKTPVLKTDVLVIGAGIAGAAAALSAADAGKSVLCLSKTAFEETNTAYAQGGVAAVLDSSDSPASHLADTLGVGGGIADPDLAQSILERGPEAVAWLEGLGARFDRDPGGSYLLGREGGHSRSRVVHANGDATGLEIQRALSKALLGHQQITCMTHTFVRDLLRSEGRCCGAVILTERGEMAVEAGAVILAAGGAGQVYRETTNPIGACGDGVALAFRAGADLADMEFVQFHPTTLYIAGASRFLITEVVRGAGAKLRDREGKRFMEGLHPQAELAPRDVVSRAILQRMVDTDDTHVYLDLSDLDRDPHQRFPSISRICRAFDIDIAKDPIPVRPGAHYFLGGVRIDGQGRSTVDGLFAVGEASASFFHGANRLASNSLLEGAVLGKSAGTAAAEDARPTSLPARMEGLQASENPPRLHLDDMLYSLKSLMWRQVGLIRDRQGLIEARERIDLWHHYLLASGPADQRGYELTNMLTVSALVAAAATLRQESRGTHFRSDYPERDDGHWCRHVFLRRKRDGSIEASEGELCTASDR